MTTQRNGQNGNISRTSGAVQRTRGGDGPLQMHPVYLGFSDPQLEQRFVEGLDTGLFALFDKSAWRAYTLLNSWAFACMMWTDFDCVKLLLSIGSVMLLHKLIIDVPSKTTYTKHRQRFVILLRLAYTVGTVIGQPGCCDIDHYLKFNIRRPLLLDVVWHSGLLAQCIYSLLLPLTLKNHIITQVAQFLIWGLSVNQGFCTTALRNKDHISSVIKQGWELVPAAARDLLATVSYPLQPDSSGGAASQQQCLELLWYLQLCVGLVITSLVCYKLELSKRRRFLEAALRDEPARAAAAEELCLHGWSQLYCVGVVLVAAWLLVDVLVWFQGADGGVAAAVSAAAGG